MILLQPDCLVFKTSDGDNIPCSVQEVTVQLIGESVSEMDDEVIHNAAQAVLHYFKKEIGKTLVSVGEFAQALERVLRGLGFEVSSSDVQDAQDPSTPVRVVETDLCRLASSSGEAFELVFFPILREELRRQLRRHPHLIRFVGLRACVKSLLGAKRRSIHCQQVEEQIVAFLRHCLQAEQHRPSCTLVVQ